MTRPLATLLTLAVVAGFAPADIPPPPPAKDEKDVSVTCQVLLGKDVSGYVFVQRVGQGPGAPRYTYEKIELDPKKAKVMPDQGRYTYVSLLAVPEAVAKEYTTDKDLFAALDAGKVKGVHQTSMGGGGRRVKKDAVKGDSLTETYTITAIDPKEGIKTSKAADGQADPKKPEDKKPLALLEQPGYLIGGLAVAAGVLFAGLWLARRKK